MKLKLYLLLVLISHQSLHAMYAFKGLPRRRTEVKDFVYAGKPGKIFARHKGAKIVALVEEEGPVGTRTFMVTKICATRSYIAAAAECRPLHYGGMSAIREIPMHQNITMDLIARIESFERELVSRKQAVKK